LYVEIEHFPYNITTQLSGRVGRAPSSPILHQSHRRDSDAGAAFGVGLSAVLALRS